MANAELLADLAELKAAARVAKEEARKAKITAQVAKIKSAGNKRSVSKLMEILFIVDDVDEPWLKLGKKAEEDGAKVADKDNLDRVNEALEGQAAKLAELRKLVTKELGMHAVAAVSGLGWDLVHSMEQNPDLDKELHGWDIDEVRANEKKLLQYNRDMNAVIRGKNLVPSCRNLILPWQAGVAVAAAGGGAEARQRRSGRSRLLLPRRPGGLAGAAVLPTARATPATVKFVIFHFWLFNISHV